MPKLVLSGEPDKQLVAALICKVTDKEADQLLCEFTSHEMGRRLETKRKDGRHGWYGPNCTNTDLLRMLHENLLKGEMIDVINLAAMIEARKRIWGETA